MEDLKAQLESNVEDENGGDNSDPSLTDSWTVLDSSHFDDDDVSDAESVEVLASDGVCISERSDCFSLCQDTFFPPENCGENTISSMLDSETVHMKETTSPLHLPSESNMDHEVPPTIEAAPKKHFLNYILDLSILLIALDIILIFALVFTNKAPFIFGLHNFSQVSESTTTRNFILDEPVLADPLLLQLSHVLSKWKKDPEEEFIASHQILKTLLAFFAENGGLDQELQALKKKMRDLETVVRSFDAIKGSGNENKQRVLTIEHLGYSTLGILSMKFKEGPYTPDCLRSLNFSFVGAQDSFCSTNIQSQIATSAIDVCFHLDHYFKARLFDHSSISENAENLQLNKALHPMEPSIFNSMKSSSVANSDKNTSFVPQGHDHKVQMLLQTPSVSSYKFDSDLKNYIGCSGSGQPCREQEINQDVTKSLYNASHQSNKTKKRKLSGEGKKNKSAINKELKQKFNVNKMERKSSKSKKIRKDSSGDFQEISSKEIWSTSFSKLSENGSMMQEEENDRKILKQSAKQRKKDKRLNQKIDDWNTRMARGREKIRASEEANDWNYRMARGRERLRALNVADEESAWIFGRAKGRGKLREEVHPL